MNALKVWWGSLRHLEHRGYQYVWANMCFMVLFIPLVTAPAGFAGLVKMSYAAHTSRHADLNTFWGGVRENIWRGMLLGVVTLAVLTINLVNLATYSAAGGLGVMVMRIVWISAIVLWMMVLFYFWPVFYEMKRPSTWGALRNAAMMILFNPGFTLALWAGLILLWMISMVIPPLAILMSFSLASVVSVRAVRNRLEVAGYSTRQHRLISAFSGDQIG